MITILPHLTLQSTSYKQDHTIMHDKGFNVMIESRICCCEWRPWCDRFFYNRHRPFVKGFPPWRRLRPQWHVYMTDFWPSTIDNTDPMIILQQTFQMMSIN
jgi:hypothetical protein